MPYQAIRDGPGRLHRSLLHPRTDRTKAGVNLAWGRAENERDDSVTGDLDILERAHDMDFTRAKSQAHESREIRGRHSRICQNDTCPACVFDGELGLSVLTGNTTDRSRQVVTMQGFDVLDFERVEIQVV